MGSSWHVKVTPSKRTTPPPPRQIGKPPVLKLFTPAPLRQEVATSAFLTRNYFRKAQVYISEAIITN